jgi:hypothetical protein
MHYGSSRSDLYTARGFSNACLPYLPRAHTSIRNLPVGSPQISSLSSHRQPGPLPRSSKPAACNFDLGIVMIITGHLKGFSLHTEHSPSPSAKQAAQTHPLIVLQSSHPMARKRSRDGASAPLRLKTIIFRDPHCPLPALKLAQERQGEKLDLKIFRS